MKKVLLSTSIAVLLVVALAVTAFAVDVSGPSTISTGDTINITITGTSQGTSGIVSVDGLRITNVDGTFSSASDFIVLADTPGGMSATYTCTVTAGPGETASLTVSDVVVSDGNSDTAGSTGRWSATVAADEPQPTDEPTQAPEPTQEPTTQPTTQPTAEPTEQPTAAPSSDSTVSAAPSGSATATVSAAASSSSKPAGVTTTSTKRPTSSSGSTKTDKMPKTGDTTMDLWTLAVIAGACAAVAIVAGKKVFSAK